MLYSDSSKKTDKAVTQQQVFKRPHGVAVQNIGDYLTAKEGDTEEKEFNMKVSFIMANLAYLNALTLFLGLSRRRKGFSSASRIYYKAIRKM